ncbi:AAA family ATPase [Desulfospira joergensenii]|uniref:cytidylate kinase-like family protein n=1 Tax=Desulfospira joergensenii TaxID=53329 RepID=UPI0003B3E221|nr:cytidylate kinase-like family protein [Desulfospira joergensenii]
MAIITISRGTYSMGKFVAEKVAEKLEFDIISRDLLFATSDRFKIPRKKLEKAIHDAPGIFEQYRHTKEIYLAYIRATLIERVAKGNIVYHGLAGHLLLNRLPHVFRVRLTASLKSRVQRKIQEGLSEVQARTKILEDDEHRKKWTQKIYHADPTNSTLYDLVVCIDKFSLEDAVDLICQGALKKPFEPTPECKQQTQDLLLACNLKAVLVESFPEAGVTCEYGNILVYAREGDSQTSKFKKCLQAFQQENKGVHNLEVHTGLPMPADAV